MRIDSWKGSALVIAATASALVGAQQPVTVRVNGQVADVQARQVGGRVLVPVRGVMEQLGATVDYIPATGIVNASKGGMNVQLRLGSQQAMVNGQAVRLDVPAQAINGRTMVPLRFLSEALGANVNWNAQTETVNITTGAGAAESFGTDQEDSNLKITSFESGAQGIVASGGAIDFTLYGTPGETATVQIPGATGEVPMTEVSPGKYEAHVTFPPDRPIALMEAEAIAKLRSPIGMRVSVLPAPINIDTEAPTFTNIWPKDTLVPDLRPSINATFSDGIGPGVAPGGIRMLLDGLDVTPDIQSGDTFVRYTPPADLATGMHTVQLRVMDRAGNVTEQKWAFTTVNAYDLAKSIAFDMPASLAPGQQIAITMIGAPNSKASCSIGTRVADLPMQEVSPGVYKAIYTIQPGDVFYNDRVVGRIVTQDNQVFSLTAPQTVLIAAAPLGAPSFVSPAADAAVGDSVTLQGSGPANARVHVWIDYHSHVTSSLSVAGRLYDAIVPTDGNGNFSTGPIKLDPGLASGQDIRFTAHVIGLGWDGKTSSETTVSFRRS